MIGNVDSAAQARVDRVGVVTPWRAEWSLGWWVRASDRWHVPAEETGTAVSQRHLDGAPVVETGMRVPGGHVVHRAWCVVDGDTEWIVVEVENRSREPVGVAFPGIPRHDAVVFPRKPSRVLLDVPHDAGEESWPKRGPAAPVFPLAHTARMRLATPLVPTKRTPPVKLAALPDAERVARGWGAHIDAPGAMRLVVPDREWRGAVGQLLVTHDDPDAPVADRGAALVSLSRFGHHATVRRALTSFADDVRRARWRGTGALLVALASHHRLSGDPVPDDVVGPVAAAAHKLRRRSPDDPWTPLGQRAAAEVLEAAGQPEAAAGCRDLVAAPTSTTPLVSILDALRDVVIAEDDGGIAVAPGFPDEWLGQDVEVHDAPTAIGPVSYAIRWHGARPALLWEAAQEVRVTAPRLDPAWSATAAAGEALLAPVEPAGGLPGVVAPLGGGTPAGSAPEAASWE